MSPFWFFLELWDLVRIGTGFGPGGGGQTSLKLMDGRSLAPVCHSCVHITSGLTWAPSRRAGLGLISGLFRRRFRGSFLVHFAGGFGTHVGPDSERLRYPRSSKKANGISEDPSPKLRKLPLHASQVLSGLTELVLLCFVRLPSLGQ